MILPVFHWPLSKGKQLNKPNKLEKGGVDSPLVWETVASQPTTAELLCKHMQFTSPMEIPLPPQSPGWLDSHQHEDPERDSAV